MEKINNILKQLQYYPISLVDNIPNGFKIEYQSKECSTLTFKMDLEKIIFPLREGEFIKNIKHLKEGEEYSLSYPGTASTKCMVLMSHDGRGIFIGGVPTYEWAKIRIKRTRKSIVRVSYHSREHNFYFLSFRVNWRLAADQYKKLLEIDDYRMLNRKVKYMLQIGVKDSFKNCHIKSFEELKEPIDYFYKHIGPGHIIHLFGTNTNGFDRMAPRYNIDPELGGEKGFTKLIKYCKKLGFLTSHHYNPRFADSAWIDTHPEYKAAIVRKGDHSYVKEIYKEQIHNYMNPNNEMWYQRCMVTIKYLKSLGLDYIELDQFTYQRNFYNSNKPLQLGYKRMMEECGQLGIKFWLEGVSDIHKLNEGNFYQILTRDIPQKWEDNESRRGYPHGISYPSFFMYLYPNAEVSFQLVSEKNNLADFEKRLKIARRIKASVYDLQMTFYEKEKYMKLLKKVIIKIKEHGAKKG